MIIRNVLERRAGRGSTDGRGEQGGQSLVEFTLLLPVLLIILAGLLDVGRLYYVYVAVTDAAAEGARYASMYPDDTGGIRERAAEASGGLVEISEDQASVESSNDSITVTVTYSFTVLTPVMNAIVPEGTIPLRGVVVESR